MQEECGLNRAWPRKSLVFGLDARPGRTSRDCGNLGYFSDVPGAGAHWNIGLAKGERLDFAGYARTSVDTSMVLLEELGAGARPILGVRQAAF